LPRKSVIFQQTQRQKAESKGYFSSLAPVPFVACSLFHPGNTEPKLYIRIRANGIKIFLRLKKNRYPLRLKTLSTSAEVQAHGDSRRGALGAAGLG